MCVCVCVCVCDFLNMQIFAQIFKQISLDRIDSQLFECGESGICSS